MDDNSKSKPGWLLPLCVLLIFGSYANAQAATGNCSDQTLYGDYGIQIEGTLLAPNWTIRTVSMVHFDGTGTFTFVDFAVINGTPRSEDWTSGTGTYSVNPNCTASANFFGVIPVHLVVVNNGKDFRGVADGDALTLVGSRVH